MSLSQVLLEKFAHFKVNELSGGMKRRLSVAICIVSDPKVIYFDEPSTGLDPENRRQLWDILASLKGKKAMILTTHSMEEADILCNRIAIMNNGILRCIAPSTRLKNLYGGGYNLQINIMRPRYFELKKKMEKLQTQKEIRKNKTKSDVIEHPSLNPSNYEKNEKKPSFDLEEIKKGILDFVYKLNSQADLIQDFNGNLIFLLPMSQKFSPSKLYLQMENNKERLYIQDWGLTQSSLEDVFIKICEQNQGNNA